MKNVLITGASSGIGKELARLYAEAGANVALTARRKDSLKKIADELKSSGAKGKILFASLDVSDTDQNFKVIPKLAKELGGLDLIVLNAGISTTASFGGRSFEADRAVIETNLIGAMAGVEAALPIFQKQKSGQIAAISSVASFRGLPGSASYSSSKAGLSTYMEALRGEVRRYGVSVTVIHPGFIDTPINNQMKSRPFVVPVEKGARKIYKRIENKVLSATVPWFPWVFLGYFMKRIPEFLWSKIGLK
ncbi:MULTISPECIES: SDR family oxidoreductase [Leptospira]|uniref:KR domain protein n=5 Tax=Leptospira borgpetersenii TaxID=174 RepID=M3G9M6_LEPBO|nr:MULTISPECIES: SDR family oxidoreductase [Leptospira]EMF97596.1 KR domain protein [Leptospira borgpetersenii str. 200701203]EMO09469.1 KR domain protein [Leptospira borgpetersenii str. Noumea 25]ALO28196.1 KR domain protein [Leptospira borgpetersenii serovar Ballum]ANH02308.1 3-ketoacyl-ACP reductase [Leptospira borgpetersenii str. 4E]AXX17643.1 SDR family oxidoreductase [Leptospira borgpetersenii serovar Ceylonica]